MTSALFPKTFATLAAFVVTICSQALAAPGDLDLSFGTGGKIITDVSSSPDFCRGVVVQPDGKIVAVGYSGNGMDRDDFSVVRYLANGSLDTSFGTGGKVVVDVADGSLDRANGLALQNDGKIVIAGNCTKGSVHDFALVRLNVEGTLDTGFGTGGKVTTDFSNASGDYALGVAVQSDGKIVVSGLSDSGSGQDFALARYLSNGALDTTFGSGGKVVTQVGTLHDYAQNVIFQTDGKILAAGGARSTTEDFAVVRYLPNGTLDTTFGINGSGKAVVPVGAFIDYGRSIALQSDGKILVAGEAFNGNNYDFGLVRLLSNGSLDNSFGNSGRVTVSFGSYDNARAVAVQGSRIFVAGDAMLGSTYHFILVCLKPDGTLDNSFGIDGKVTTAVGTDNANAYAMALQSDGKILLAGESYTDAGYVFGLVRYQGEGPDIKVEQPWGAALSDGSATVDFGNAVVFGNQVSRSFALKNVGWTALTGISVRLDGANADDFRIVTQPWTTLPANSEGGFEINFRPTAAGSRTAMIHIESNDPDENPFDIILTGTALPEVAIATGNPLPAATVGVPYSVTLAATGGSAPYTWWLGDGVLPGGLTLNSAGVLSGTPTAVTNANFPVWASGGGGSGLKIFDLRVLGASEPGAVDATFATGGKVVTLMGASNGRARGLALQPDGKILQAGSSTSGSDCDFALLRYHPDGSLDTTFGNAGKATTPLGSLNDYGRSVAVQSDGRIVVAGDAYNENDSDFALVRYQANGTLDTSFGNGGKVITPISGSSGDTAVSVALQSDGKILVAGSSDNGNPTYDIALVRYLANGTLDTSFGTGGKVLTPIGSADDSGMSVAVQSDGKIVVAGLSDNGENTDFALVRYNPNGTLDTGFGNTGKVVTAIGAGDDGAWSVALQGDNKIVTAGFASDGGGNDYDFAVARYLANGTLDPAFGSGGKAVTDLGSGSDDTGRAVCVLPDGSIVVAGSANAAGNYDFALAQYRTDGTPDPSFGDGGKMLTAIGTSDDYAWSVAMQNDGNLVVSGDSRNGSNYDFMLVRYMGAPHNAGAAPQITTASPLPNGMISVPYSVALTATGGVAPYTWSVAGGSLPVGFSLSSAGVLAGTPSAGFSGSFNALVSGANGLSSTQALALTITRVPRPGDLDTSFGTGGKVATSFRSGDDQSYSAVVLSSGKILVAGYTVDDGNNNFDFALARFNADGTPDTAFGTGGKVTTEVADGLHYGDFGRSIALQSDGKFLVGGEAWSGGSYAYAMARYHPDGSLDTSFGSAGKVKSSAGFAKAVLVQNDGKIVLAGHFGIDFGLDRYLPNGTLDSTFGSGGKVTTDFNNANGADYAQAAALQSDGKIVVVGYAPGAKDNDVAVVRYLTNGNLDPAFGTGGKVSTPVGTFHDYGWSVVMQNDGKILVAGDQAGDFLLLRYLTDGSLDPSFGTGGKVTTSIGNYDASARSVALQVDGKILAAGYVSNGQNYDFALLRYLPNGTLDDSFGTAGKVIMAIGTGHDYGRSVVLQPDGNIVVAGSTDSGGGNDDFAVVRFLGDANSGLVAPQVTTASPLPSGMVEVPYAISLTAKGGLVPYAWSVAGGSLPPGFSLSAAGLLAGTPTAPITANFDVRVTSANGLASTQALALTIVRTPQPGDLDPTFGTGGKVVTAVGNEDDFGYALGIQPDGKLVVGGYSLIGSAKEFALVRYLPDGSLDTTFGNGGKVMTHIGLSAGFGRSLVIQPDGKIVLAGEYWRGSYSFAMVRYLSNGAVDTAFGTGGRVTNAFGTSSYAKTVLLQSDGKIVLAGELHSDGIDYGLMRYLPNGMVDTSFGSLGMVGTDFGLSPGFDYAQGAALQPDDKIVVAGYVPGTNGSDFGVVRYLPNGALDTSFGNGGKIITQVGTAGDVARCVAVQNDGKIIVAGEVSRDLALMRYLPDGALDPSFGTGGKKIAAITTYEFCPRTVLPLDDGKFVIAGHAHNGQNYDFALARFLANGVVDTSFGTAGVVMTRVSTRNDYGRSAVIQSDGMIVLAGDADDGANSEIALARYFGSTGPEISIEQPAGTRLIDGTASIAFGGIEPGATVVRSFVIKNTGTATLTGLALTKEGPNSAEFNLGALGATSLGPGGILTFTVSFTPAALGARTATLHIASNDSDENPFDIALSGTGGAQRPLHAWRIAHFGSPDNSGAGANGNDFDGDGYVNLLEYASGANPKASEAADIRPAAISANGMFLYTFICDARCTDITYTVQMTSALQSTWIDIAQSVGGVAVSPKSALPSGGLCQVTDTGAGLRKVTVALPASSFSNGTGFLRLKVSE